MYFRCTLVTPFWVVSLLNFNHSRGERLSEWKREITWEIQRQIAIEMEQYVNHLIFLFEFISHFTPLLHTRAFNSGKKMDKKRKFLRKAYFRSFFKFPYPKPSTFPMQIWLFHISFFFSSPRSSSLSFPQSSETIKFQLQTEDSLDWIFEVGSKPLWSQLRTNFQFHWSNSVTRHCCVYVTSVCVFFFFFFTERKKKIDLGQVPFLYLFISDGIQINCYRSSVVLTVCVCACGGFRLPLRQQIFLFSFFFQDNFHRLIVNAINERKLGKCVEFYWEQTAKRMQNKSYKRISNLDAIGQVRLKFHKASRFNCCRSPEICVIFSEN